MQLRQRSASRRVEPAHAGPEAPRIRLSRENAIVRARPPSRRLHQQVLEQAAQDGKALAVCDVEAEQRRTDAACVVRALVNGMFRQVGRLEVFLGKWIHAAVVRESPMETIFQMLERIMGRRVRMRIENQCILFLDCPDIRVFYEDLSRAEATLLLGMLQHWDDFFDKMTFMVQTDTRPTYTDCLFNDVIESVFPRTHIACRYLAQMMRALGRGACPGQRSAIYERAWIVAYQAVWALYTRRVVKTIAAIAPLLAILNTPADIMCWYWDPSKKVHP